MRKRLWFTDHNTFEMIATNIRTFEPTKKNHSFERYLWFSKDPVERLPIRVFFSQNCLILYTKKMNIDEKPDQRSNDDDCSICLLFVCCFFSSSLNLIDYYSNDKIYTYKLCQNEGKKYTSNLKYVCVFIRNNLNPSIE